MMVHHGMTVTLLLICYAINMVPIGLVIAVLHDMADIFLEVQTLTSIVMFIIIYLVPQIAKLCVYISCSALANCTFCAFSLVFIATRLVVLPNW